MRLGRSGRWIFNTEDTEVHRGPRLVVDERLIVEVKAVERLLPIHDAQLLTYLKLARLKLGLLLNFNVAHFRDGLRRKVL